MRNFDSNFKPAHTKQREGYPATMYEELGPFTMKVSNKGFYEIFEVAVTGGVVIIKQASRPGLECVCNALHTAYTGRKVPKEVYEHYISEVNQLLHKK